ncbi:hypothetical protein EG68_06307 [Paragonimus skrjabini miyazakii]|uniref:Uncharacterized protein n=1 Tax=Paragonimus skrjabini miyazakii TaxID=59628 RepID=A0A8S9YVK0_9TREM|nr:hypothetical protein EG68_06307 [Paragonimus skrjabini miyazakii]
MAFSIGNYWLQRTISLKKHSRGCHYVTDEIKVALPEIKQIKMGVLHLFIQHTSATLIVNESWDPSVKTDIEMLLNRLFPESLPYKHSCEGPDDMPAHAKQAFLGGPSISLPISEGKLALGTWQGIWLCEHRNSSSSRQVVATINGCPFDVK